MTLTPWSSCSELFKLQICLAAGGGDPCFLSRSVINSAKWIIEAPLLNSIIVFKGARWSAMITRPKNFTLQLWLWFFQQLSLQLRGGSHSLWITHVVTSPVFKYVWFNGAVTSDPAHWKKVSGALKVLSSLSERNPSVSFSSYFPQWFSQTCSCCPTSKTPFLSCYTFANFNNVTSIDQTHFSSVIM